MSAKRRQSGRNFPWIIAAVLVLGTLACYWPVRHFNFVNYDDTIYVYKNAQVRQGLSWSGVIWAFQSRVANNWHPLTWLSHMADCQFFGLNPGWHHLVNLALHIANVLLLFVLLRRMTGATWPSAFVAALFAWHPMHVESVAWVAERKDVLSTFFFLLTLLAYVNSKIQIPNSKFQYFLALFFFACALLSKPMVVTLPFVLLLLDWWPLGRLANWKKAVMEKLPFFALSLASCIITYHVQNAGGTVVETAPLLERLESSLISYGVYLGKLFWPGDMAVLYPYPNSFPLWQIAISGLSLALVSAVVITRARQQPALAVGWFWFLGTLVPVVGLVQIGSQMRADRYTYIPYIGSGIMLAWVFPRRNSLVALAAGLALLGCLVKTQAQLAYWQNSLALCKHAVNVTSGNYVMHNNLGLALVEDKKQDEAKSHFAEAVRLKPEYSDAHCNLATALAIEGKIDDAIAEFKETLRLDPHTADAYDNLGGIYLMQHKLDEAIAMCSQAIKLNPNLAGAYWKLGHVYGEQGKSEEALAEFKIAAELDPNQPAYLNNLAWTYATDPDARLRNGAEAVRLAESACQLTGDRDERFLGTLAAAYAEAGRFSDAIRAAEQTRAAAAAHGNRNAENSAEREIELFKAGKPLHIGD